MVSGEQAELDDAREVALKHVGAAGTVDAAAIVGNFERMNRIANAIGIPLEAPTLGLASDVVEELQLGEQSSAAHTGELSGFYRALGQLARAAIPAITQLQTWLRR